MTQPPPLGGRICTFPCPPVLLGRGGAHSETVTCLPISDTCTPMDNHGLFRPSLWRLWPRVANMFVLLVGATNCEKAGAPEPTPAASAIVPVPVEVPAAQPPRFTDQPILAPPSLSPPTAHTNSTAQVVPSAGASTHTTSLKSTSDAPASRHPSTTSPGPMAPRPHGNAEAM